MLDFKPIEISDKEWVDELLGYSDYRGSEYCFTNLFIWDPVYKSLISRYKDFMLIRSGSPGSYKYLYPAGKGDKKEALEAIIADAGGNNSTFSLIGLSPEAKEELENIMPGMFELTTYRDSFDYIYESERLISLSGKKLQSKRNHINFFKSTYDWSYEELREELIPEVIEFNTRWCKEADCNKHKTLELEICAVRKCLDNYQQLNISGGVLRVNGEIVAYTIGEKINSDTAIIHIEKALTQFRGAYPMINREFAERISAGLSYINREDDIGDPGLRIAKESYHPLFMLEKYTGTISSK